MIMLITALISSPFGTLAIEVSDLGLRKLYFTDQTLSNDEQISPVLEPYIEQLEAYFKGELKSFDLPVDWSGIPPFHREVLQMVKTIPYGKTRNYKQIANVLGRPKASRAVGQANGKNPIVIVIPCHRVIGTNGDLTGYAYGVGIKRQLLALEMPSAYATQAELFQFA
jgi:methylated-DNA-[protein]-cysteine S-methyltransferase